jgi:hypothetical protein
MTGELCGILWVLEARWIDGQAQGGMPASQTRTIQIRASASQGSSLPRFESSESGSLSDFRLTARLTVTDAEELGRNGHLYVVAYVPRLGFFVLSGREGWQMWDGKSLLSNFAPATLGTHELRIFEGMDLAGILGEMIHGTEVYAGYGYGLGLGAAQDYMMRKARFDRVKVFE